MTDVLEGVRFGRILVDRGFVDEEDLRLALEEQRRCAAAGVLLRLGQVLLRQGRLTRDQLLEALRIQGRAELTCSACGEAHESDATTECGACAGPLVRPTAPREAIGRFEIVREIDRGSMGTVYEAVDPRLGRAVALKVLEERPGMRSFVERFHLEGACEDAARARVVGLVGSELAAVELACGLPFGDIGSHAIFLQTLLEMGLERPVPRPASTAVDDLWARVALLIAAGDGAGAAPLLDALISERSEQGTLWLHPAFAHALADNGEKAHRDREIALRLLPPWPQYEVIAGESDISEFLDSRFASARDEDF